MSGLTPPDPATIAGLQSVSEALPPESLIATFSNNQLRAIAADTKDDDDVPMLTKEQWYEFASLNRDTVEAHRAFWGIDIDAGWEDRSWATPEGTYAITNPEQSEFAKTYMDKELKEVKEEEVKEAEAKSAEAQTQHDDAMAKTTEAETGCCSGSGGNSGGDSGGCCSAPKSIDPAPPEAGCDG